MNTGFFFSALTTKPSTLGEKWREGREREGASTKSDIADESHFLAEEGSKEVREKKGAEFYFGKNVWSGGKENYHSVHKHGAATTARAAVRSLHCESPTIFSNNIRNNGSLSFLVASSNVFLNSVWSMIWNRLLLSRGPCEPVMRAGMFLHDNKII